MLAMEELSLSECEDSCLQKKLFHATSANDVEALVKSISAGADVNRKNTAGETVLYRAALEGSFEAAQALVDWGADLTLTDPCGMTPLDVATDPGIIDLLDTDGICGSDQRICSGYSACHYAVQEGCIDSLEMLLHYSADINIIDDNKLTPLALAVKLNNIFFIEYLISKGANTKKTPVLHLAAKYDCVESMTKLLQCGLKVDEVAYYNEETPLIVAVKNNRLNMIHLLLAQGSSVNWSDYYARTALHYAVKQGRVNFIEILLQNGACVHHPDINGLSPMALAAQLGKLCALKLLVNDITTLDDGLNNHSLLHIASEWGHTDVVAWLLNIGVNVNRTGKDKSTALNFAVDSGNIQVVKLLLERGADVNNAFYNWTPLHSAVVQCDLQLVKLLVQNNADVNHRSCSGTTPFILSVYNYKRCPNIFSLLLDRRADLNITDDYGYSALHVAASTGNRRLVRLLLDKGADINAIAQRTTCNSQKTPLGVAIETSHVGVAELLQSRGGHV